jgi:hypothetical protein
MAQEAQGKGLQFRSFVRSMQRLRGEAAVNAMLGLLSGDLADALRLQTIVTGGWYPVAWYRQLHPAAQKATGEGHDLIRAIARDSVRDDFRGVYRLIPMVLSPQGIFRRAPLVARLYWDIGKVTVTDARDRHARAEFVGFHGFDENVWVDFTAGVVGVLELCGAKNVRQHVIAGGKDGPDMVLEVTWGSK